MTLVATPSVVHGDGPLRPRAGTSRRTQTVRPPAVPRVGVVGGGPLARLLHLAALPLGVGVVVLERDPVSAAGLAGARVLPGQASSPGDLAALAQLCDVVTVGPEPVPTAHLAALEAAGVAVAPGAGVAELAADAAVARRRLADHGYPVAPTPGVGVAVDPSTVSADATAATVAVAVTADDAPTVGPAGPIPAAGPTDAASTLAAPAANATELSVLVARSRSGEVACYDPVVVVRHDDTRIDLVAPAPVPVPVAAEAGRLASSIAERFALVGVMAVELRLLGDDLVVDGVVPGPHRSGHHTIEAAETSQFDQHLRAVLGWPLGPTALRRPVAVTCTVLGAADGCDPRRHLASALAVPGAHVHLYDERARPGHELGHVTVLADTIDEATAPARRAAAMLAAPAPPPIEAPVIEAPVIVDAPAPPSVEAPSAIVEPPAAATTVAVSGPELASAS